jgi:hypothetical protein
MQLSNLIPNFVAGLPLTAIAIIAVVVLLAWLTGGVGRATGRLAIGIPYLTVLLGLWLLLLLEPVDASKEDSTFWVAVVLTATSFAVPILWRKYAKT